ncbi:MAG: hypothetical protein FJ109_13170 [Deltaproteobacteria bacterium]|nr:hypothetical protein [Deltaproteobacteria bacterium]
MVVLLGMASLLAGGPALGQAISGKAPLPVLAPLNGPGAARLDSLWRECIEEYRDGKFPDLLVKLDDLRKVQLDTGIPNLTPISAALVRMADEVLERSPNDSDLAESLVRQAEVLSPQIPDFHFTRSNMLYRIDRSRLGEYVGAFFQGVRASLHHPPTLQGLFLGALGLFWLAGVLVMVLFSVSLLVRHLATFAHDFGHLFPRALSPLQLNVIALVLLSAPFLADLGLVPLFVLWWIAMWLYTSVTEKAVAMLMVLFLYAWPVLTGVVGGALAFPDSPPERAYRCMTEVCTEAEMAELERQLSEEQSHALILYSAALARFRDAGQKTDAMERSFSFFRRGEKELAGDMKADFSVGLGNAFFLKGMQRCGRAGGLLDAGLGDFQSAVKSYDAAMAIRPDDWAAAYNKFKVLTVLGDPSAADAMLSRSAGIAPELVRDLQQRTQMSGEKGCLQPFEAMREMAFHYPGFQVLWGEAFGLDGPSHDSSRLSAGHVLLLGSVPLGALPVLATIAMLCNILLLVIGRKWHVAGRCIKCHSVSCIRCRPELTGSGLCNQCVHYKLRSSYVDPKETWLREKRIESAIRFRRRAEIVLTLLFPGAGQLLRGRALRGVAFLWLFGMTIGAVFFYSTLASLAAPPVAAFAVGSVVGTAFWGAVSFVVFFLSLLDIYSWR